MPAPTPCLCAALRRATRSVTRVYDDALRPLDLRITQFSLLRQLVRHGERTMRELAALVVIEETALNRAARGLESRGWIAIRTGEDRRARVLAITAAGRALLAEAEPRWHAVQRRMAAELGADWQVLLTSLEAVTASAAP
ncbi:MAG TPA: MarR family transcriptional regulator [Kofleriaceae bacterium]|nr:MarR family transcriptional regulator [Kofleriaceae bacterium]